MSDATHGTPFQAPEVEEVARLFPSFEILGLIACGGMGAVYHAVQTSLERPVAIKILPREFSTDEEFRAGFESEAKAMAKLNHPNLIGVYDFGEVGGMLFIVMEYVAGKSLHQAAHGCAVEQADALAMVIGVCHGLVHAHEYGILHRDIKPSNILLDGHMNPKIGDFGLARALEREIQHGEQIFGTPGYTAPEVLQPPFVIDQRADIFSVGVMLHELLTGRLPDADPRPASQISGCNHRLDAVIQRATHPDPARRYSSAMELARELGIIAALPNRTIRTGPPVARAGPVGVSPALSKPAHSALSKPASALAPRPHVAFNTPQSVVKESSGSGLVIFLVIALAAAVAVFFLIQGNKRPPAAPAPPPQAGGTSPPAELAPEPAADVKASPEDVKRRVRASIRQRVGPAIESQRRDMRTNVSDYKSALEAAAEGLPLVDKERVGTAISANMREWESDGNRIPESVPAGFRPIDNAVDLHTEYFGKQAAIQRNFEVDMATLAGVYVLELENQIGKLEKDGNAQAADALEEEVRAVNADPGRFRSLMLE